MSRITPIARILLGLVFLVFAANYFVPFLPPQPMSPQVLAFVVPFAGTGLLTFIKVVEIIAAVGLIANRCVPLALALLAPIIVGITGFHAALAPSGMPIAIALIVLELFLAYRYRTAFAPMLAPTARPAPATPTAVAHAASATA